MSMTAVIPSVYDSVGVMEEQWLMEDWSPEVFPFATELPPYDALPLPETLEDFCTPERPIRYRNEIALWVFWKLRKERKTEDAGQLDQFFDRMPLDIIFAIFDFLHPLDLYHLARTTKSLRSILTNRASMSSWKNSYNQEPSMPRCPECVPELRWANILFGPSRCERCDTHCTSTYITLARRLCGFCVGIETITRYELDQIHGDFDWSLVPQPWVLHSDLFSRCYYYDRKPVEAIANEYRRLTDAVRENPETQAEFDEFVQRQHAIGTAHKEDTTRCIELLEEALQGAETENTARYETLATQIKKRLRSLGFVNSDFDGAKGNFSLADFDCLARIHRLTKKAFKRTHLAIGHYLVAERELRKKKEREDLVESRRKVVDEVYSKYREHCVPATWAYHPPAYTIQTWEPFATLISDPSDLPLVEAKCVEGVKSLPGLVAEWTFNKINQLASLLPKFQRNDPTSSEWSIQDLELATAVFHCLGSRRSANMNGRCLIGWDGAGSHSRCGALKSWYDNRVHFNERGYTAALSLVEVLELDPKKTTAKEMDHQNDRFLCQNCPGPDRKAYAWRDAIRHYLDAPDHGVHKLDLPPSWILLTPEAAADIRRQEGVDPHYHEKSWCCNLCPEHWHVSVKRAEAIIHHIQAPVPNIHFIFFNSSTYTYQQYVKFQEDLKAKYRCARCPESVRLYPMRALLGHLRDKHQVTQAQAVADDDWTEVERIIRRTPGPKSSQAEGDIGDGDST
ncbi:hypothetical protein BDN72DRAFT_839830 [Pluteus cervinus]|uniref:Uncharacterized protein n=1 Tax=Pluteus cervinus TaxID=181527 RepID=A0ACD3AWB2_9AGAR|nr:hypothetical protein BDN72DRAFT_839830 [Pluteus cervinus]